MDVRTHIDQVEQGVINSLNAVRQLLADQDRVLQFGNWADWEAADIRYLLDELRVGHWNDCSDKVPGYVLASDALDLVLKLDFAQGEQDEMVFRGIRSLADTLSHFAEAEDSLDLCEQIIALVDIFRAERKAKAAQ